jgi:hypothetical protein
VVKSLFALAAILLLTGCPPDVYDPAIPGGGTGTLQFHMGKFCATPYTVIFTVDNVDIGTETLGPDLLSEFYTMGNGVHTVRARATSPTTKTWPNVNLVVVSEANVIQDLPC